MNEEQFQSGQDSFTVGSASKYGAVKTYFKPGEFHPDNRKAVEDKIKFAVLCAKFAELCWKNV